MGLVALVGVFPPDPRASQLAYAAAAFLVFSISASYVAMAKASNVIYHMIRREIGLAESRPEEPPQAEEEERGDWAEGWGQTHRSWEWWSAISQTFEVSGASFLLMFAYLNLTGGG